MIHLDEHGTWATIPEAAARYGVQPVTIYAWTYRKNIRTEKVIPHGCDDQRPRVHVRIDDIAAYIRARDHAVESDQPLPELCPEPDGRGVAVGGGGTWPPVTGRTRNVCAASSREPDPRATSAANPSTTRSPTGTPARSSSTTLSR